MTIVKRWKAKTPRFFRSLIRFGSALVLISTAIYAFQYYTELPEEIKTYAGYLFAIGTTVSIISKLAVEDIRDTL